MQTRRGVLRTLGAAGAAASVAGCSSAEGEDCGPGEDEIGTLADGLAASETAQSGGDSFAQVQGEVQSVSDNQVLVDDGTGAAMLTTVGGAFGAKSIEDGDCMAASGSVAEPESDSADVKIWVEGMEIT